MGRVGARKNTRWAHFFVFPVAWQRRQAPVISSDYQRLGFPVQQSSGRATHWLTWDEGLSWDGILSLFSLHSVGVKLKLRFVSLFPSSLPPSHFPQVLWPGLHLPDPPSKSLGLERQPVFPFKLQDGRGECWGSHTWLRCQMLGCQAVSYFYNPLHTRPQQMTTCREAKQGMGRDQDNWNRVGESSKESGSLKNSGIGAGALLVLLCCPVGLVWALL
jgi:hypothetical protein